MRTWLAGACMALAAFSGPLGAEEPEPEQDAESKAISAYQEGLTEFREKLKQSVEEDPQRVKDAVALFAELLPMEGWWTARRMAVRRVRHDIDTRRRVQEVISEIQPEAEKVMALRQRVVGFEQSRQRRAAGGSGPWGFTRNWPQGSSGGLYMGINASPAYVGPAYASPHVIWPNGPPHFYGGRPYYFHDNFYYHSHYYAYPRARATVINRQRFGNPPFGTYNPWLQRQLFQSKMRHGW